ncbi:hypothetical protein [Anaerocolumna xylanovorans]|uniref:Uncharacterized protein n=1 Tax=Anaerocolumna xylanovorans DSM 12503 TaxID=1121345 RepID=A0A1M7YKD9_9FIRM|nr:hypothetical protein [Anaerocolumna xylanovorans]SHO53062.1 hypothetical protein SAMN02745217_03938 [Anaerocolumna xylanovorans DSM 12503]
MKKIIHYNWKYVMMKLVRTCRKKHLEYRGPYQLKILQKAMPTADSEYEPVPMFYVETEDHQYHGMLAVNLIEYRKGRVGQYYRMGGVILYTRKEGCYYISKYDNPKTAIRKMVWGTRIQLIVAAAILFVILLL